MKWLLIFTFVEVQRGKLIVEFFKFSHSQSFGAETRSLSIKVYVISVWRNLLIEMKWVMNAFFVTKFFGLLEIFVEGTCFIGRVIGCAFFHLYTSGYTLAWYFCRSQIYLLSHIKSSVDCVFIDVASTSIVEGDAIWHDRQCYR